jgi:hypothetical protein
VNHAQHVFLASPDVAALTEFPSNSRWENAIPAEIYFKLSVHFMHIQAL